MQSNITLGKIWHSAFYALCFSLFLGCKLHSEENANLPQIKVFVADSVYIPISVYDNAILRIKQVPFDGKEIISFTKENTLMNYVYDMEQQKMIDSLSFSDYQNTYIDFCPIKQDSFLIGLNTNNLVLISHKHKRIININPIIISISKFAYIGFLSLEPLHIYNDTVMVTSTTTEPKKDKTKPNIPFLKANYDILIKLLPDTAILLTMHNPNPSYFQEQDYYGRAERVYLNSRKVVYSYNHSDTVTTIDLFKNLKNKVKLKTKNFTPNIPFDYSKSFDNKYITNYCLSQSRSGIGDLLFNEHDRKLYMFIKHKGLYIDSVTGAKNKWSDIPQSLFILDEKMKQLKEIYIPGGFFSSSFNFFVTHKGLYIAAADSKQKYHDKTLFYRIVIP